MANEIPGHRGTEVFAVVARHGWREEVAVEFVRNALRHVDGLLDVQRVASHANGTVVVSFHIDAEPAATERRVPAYRAALAAAADARTRTGLFGGIVLSERYSAIARDDLARAERIAFPFMLVVLLVAFVSVLAAVLPLILAAVGLVTTFACLYLLGRHAGLSVFVTNTASVLALGLSVDFSLFMVTRFREELEGRSVRDALTQTMVSTGRAVALSALTIATSLLALFAVGVELFSSMAVGATLATVVAALAALTLLPAVIYLLGPRINRLRVDRIAQAAARGTVWRNVAGIVVRHPGACVLTSIALLLIAAAPIRSFHLALHTVDALPVSDPVRQQADRMAHLFHPGSSGPIDVVTQGQIPRRLWDDPAVAQTWGETDGRAGWFALQVILGTRPDSAAARRAVVRLRRLFAETPGRAYVGGAPAASLDFLNRIQDRTRLVVVITITLGALVLAVGLRSILIPIKAVIGTLLSVAATIGIVARLFPDPNGGASLEFFVPLLLFAIVFGLSIDYEVFLLSRIREAVLSGRSNQEAVQLGLVRSARSITLAGITLATVFIGFATSVLPAFRQLGLGVAIAILIDVTVVRCVLIPASVVLLGRWNWWFPYSGADIEERRRASPRTSTPANAAIRVSRAWRSNGSGNASTTELAEYN